MSKPQAETPGLESTQACLDLVCRIDGVVQKGLAGSTGFSAKLYGSQLSGLATSSTDLDISIEGYVRTRWGTTILSRVCRKDRPSAEDGRKPRYQHIRLP